MECHDRKRHLAGAILALATLLMSSHVHAGGFSSLDFGIRRLGMLAVVARPDDGTAVYHNAAGMTLLEGTHFYTYQSLIWVDLEAKLYNTEGKLLPEDSWLGADWSVGFLPYFAVTSDLGTDDFRLGVALYAPQGFAAAIPDDSPLRYQVTDALFVAGRATVSAAYRFTDWFSAGVSSSVIYTYLHARRMMNASVLANPDLRFEPRDVTAPGDAWLTLDGQDIAWGFDLSVLFTPLDTLRIGATFSSGSPVQLRGDVKLEYLDGETPTEQAHHTTTMTLPFMVRGGINWEFAPDFELGLDVTWWHYQSFQQQRSVLSQPLMGLEELVDPKGYTNGWLWCAGLLYRVIPEVEVMVGFQMDFSPIPDRAISLENPSRDAHAISFGVRWQVSDRIRLGAAYQRLWYALVHTQESTALPPTNTKSHGGMNFFALDLTWRID